MLTTRELVRRLRQVNPAGSVSEDRVRHALRRGAIAPPATFAGRFAWTEEEALALAEALGLEYLGGVQ